jgi:hypothetical protein
MGETTRTRPITTDAHPPVRSPYHSPVLRLYGSLGHLTHGAGTGGGDGVSGMMAV